MLLSSFEPLVIIVSCSEISKFGIFLGAIQDLRFLVLAKSVKFRLRTSYFNQKAPSSTLLEERSLD